MYKFPDKINVTPETKINGISNEVALSIEGMPYKYWTSVEIVRSFDTIADTFVLSAPFVFDNKNLREVFRPFKYRPCALYVGGEKIITGEIVNVQVENSNDSSVLRVDGYSKPGRLADCCVPPTGWPLTIEGLNLRGIANRFGKIYDIEVNFIGAPGAAFSKSDRIEVVPTAYVYDVLKELATIRGFVISSDKDGKLTFQRTQPGIACPLDAGKNPYLASTFNFNGQRRYSDITTIKQDILLGSGKRWTIQEPELTENGVKRYVVLQAEDSEVGGLKEIANAKLGHMIADSVSGSVTLSGWRRYDTAGVWKDGDRVAYLSARDMIYKRTEFITREVKLIRKDNSLTTELSLILPECYSGEVRKVYPWAG